MKGDDKIAPSVAFALLCGNINENAIEKERKHLRDEGCIADDIEEFSCKSVIDEIISICRMGDEDPVIDSVLSDAALYHVQKRSNKLPSIEVQHGFIKKFKAERRCLEQKIALIESARKFVRSKKDAEVWFSRYMFGAAIELAKEGFINPLSQAISYSEDLIREEASFFFAGQIGIEMAPQDVDLVNVNKAIRTYSVNKTGYAHPGHWLAVAISNNG